VYKPTFAACGKLSDFHLLAAAGYDYLETAVADFLIPEKCDSAFQVNLDELNRLNAKIISCMRFIPAHMKITGNETFHEEILTWAEIVFSRAKRAQIPFIVFGSGPARMVPEGFDKQTATQQFIDLCKQLAPIAQKYDVTILIEPLNTGETNLINSLAEGAEIVFAVDHPNLLLLCDIYHMLLENESAEEIVIYGDIIRHCHIAEKETRSIPGTAGDDFTPYFNALKKIKYQGCISIEPNRNEEYEQRIGPALQYIKKMYN